MSTFPAIVVQGVSGNPNVEKVTDYYLGFESFGLQNAFVAGPQSITRGDVAGVQRASSVAPIKGAGARTMTTDLLKPEYVANGGPNGLSDALYFDRARGDRLLWGVSGPVGKHTLVEVVRPEDLGANGMDGLLSSSFNSGTDGKNLWYVRRPTAGVCQLVSYLDGSSGQVSQITANIAFDTWVLVARTWDPDALISRVGILLPGQTEIAWSTAAAAAAGTSATASFFMFGSEGNSTRAFKGRWAGGLYFNGYDAGAVSEMSSLIAKWATGPNSVFGL